MVKTYRFRLSAYTIALLLFLVLTLGYTYEYSRSVILEEAESNITSTAQVLNSNLELEENELLRYAEIVRDDLRIKEYMFMTSKVGTDNEALVALLDRQFGWLPVERQLVIANNGQILVGQAYTDLAEHVRQHLTNGKADIFYFQGQKGLEMVAWASVEYEGLPLGAVTLTHLLDSHWLEQLRRTSGGYLFIEDNGTVQLSTLTSSMGSKFIPKPNGRVIVDNEIYRIRRLILSGPQKHAPRIWYGVSEKELLMKLERHSRLVLILTIAGSLAILWVGLAIIRNFNKPLTQLMHMTRKVASGELPRMNKSVPRNEIDMLYNQFAEMLQALREKQQEIEIAHKELEQSAITDSLTRLYNRRYLQEVFPRALNQAQRDSLHLAGILLDIDHFKQINDQYGHLGGDECLIQFSRILRDTCRASDYIFRIGGEEFLILSIHDNRQGGELLAEKIREIIEAHPASLNDTVIPMTASAGVSHADYSLAPQEALSHLLAHADKALYAAKVGGRNQVVSHPEDPPHSSASVNAVS
jgi:diguanylate cyclase (GGDEF)-like protein